MFEFHLDRQRRFLRLKVSQYWGPEEISAFEFHLPLEWQALKSLGGPTAYLADLTEFPVQSKDVSERIEALFVSAQHIAPDRVAIVTPQTLLKMQSARVSPSRSQTDTRATFSRIEDAMAWLFADREPSASERSEA
jgi:hypothetical protein